MATGASTADVAILLVDARHGVRAQSRRHARIARLLGITNFVAGGQQDGPRRLRSPASSTTSSTSSRRSCRRRRRSTPIPMSALHGDNVITRERPDALVRRPEPARVPRDRGGRPRRRRRGRSACRCSSSCGPTTTSAATPGRSLSGIDPRRRRDHASGRRAERRASSAS